MRKFILSVAMAALAVPAATPALAQDYGHHDNGRHDNGRHGNDRHGNDRHDNGNHNGRNNRHGNDWQRGRNYDWNRPDPRYGGYDAARYYHPGNYSERRLSRNDRVYRGNDGRYYCRRTDGTTGLIVGAVAGGLLGNVIDGGRHRAGGTLIGGGLGALLGKSVDQNSSNGDYRCR